MRYAGRQWYRRFLRAARCPLRSLTMQNVHLLLGAQCSRYSARVRSYLIKNGIQYVERTPSAWTFRVSIVRRFGDAALPVLITPDGEWIADSTLILDHLERQSRRRRPFQQTRCTRRSSCWRTSGRASSGSPSTCTPAGPSRELSVVAREVRRGHGRLPRSRSRIRRGRPDGRLAQWTPAEGRQPLRQFA